MNTNPQRRKKDNLGITCNTYILYIKIYVLIDIYLGDIDRRVVHDSKCSQLSEVRLTATNEGQAPNKFKSGQRSQL